MKSWGDEIWRAEGCLPSIRCGIVYQRLPYVQRERGKGPGRLLTRVGCSASAVDSNGHRKVQKSYWQLAQDTC